MPMPKNLGGHSYDEFREILREMDAYDFGLLRGRVEEEYQIRMRALMAEGGGMTKEEHDYVKAGNRIAAVKSVRERCGLGLREAKDIVDKNYPPENR